MSSQELVPRSKGASGDDQHVEIVVMGLVRSVPLAIAGQEAEARATMQPYLANDKAPFRTMSQWRARLGALPSYSPRFLTWAKKFSDGLRKDGLPD